MRLERDQQLRLPIDSRLLWNDTGIVVSEGERYAFDASGSWKDSTIPATAAGYATKDAPFLSRVFLRFFEKSRRMPAENWFALVGAIGQDESKAFLIGEKLDGWTATGSGELACFANDVRFAYKNNHGSITLTVTRIA